MLVGELVHELFCMYMYIISMYDVYIFCYFTNIICVIQSNSNAHKHDNYEMLAMQIIIFHPGKTSALLIDTG